MVLGLLACSVVRKQKNKSVSASTSTCHCVAIMHPAIRICKPVLPPLGLRFFGYPLAAEVLYSGNKCIDIFVLPNPGDRHRERPISELPPGIPADHLLRMEFLQLITAGRFASALDVIEILRFLTLLSFLHLHAPSSFSPSSLISTLWPLDEL